MPEIVDDATQADESQETESTEESSESTATDAAAQIASYKRRQAGAEAARQAAETKAADAQKRLEAYEAANRSASDQETATLATLTEKLSAAEKRAADAEAKADARILDARFPNARKELPEVTDEIRLAKFEAMLADDGDTGSPKPGTHNESKTIQPGGRAAKPETGDDIEARLLSMKDPGWYQVE